MNTGYQPFLFLTNKHCPKELCTMTFKIYYSYWLLILYFSKRTTFNELRVINQEKMQKMKENKLTKVDMFSACLYFTIFSDDVVVSFKL